MDAAYMVVRFACYAVAFWRVYFALVGQAEVTPRWTVVTLAWLVMATRP